MSQSDSDLLAIPSSKIGDRWFTIAVASIAAVLGLSLLLYARRSPSDARIAAESRATEVVQKYGRTWRLVGPAIDHGDVGPMCLGVPQYVAWSNIESANNRLLVVIAPEDEDSSQWLKMTCEQNLESGKWISNGLDRTIYRDGRVRDGSTRNGKLDGVQRWWAANGQMIHEQSYLNGVRHGPWKGWYESGARKYESIYENNVEVSGKAWDEDGTLIGEKQPTTKT